MKRNKDIMTKILSFRIPDDLLKALEKHANKNERAVSTMARKIVREYLSTIVEVRK
jgi:predicted transcriptional regulator